MGGWLFYQPQGTQRSQRRGSNHGVSRAENAEGAEREDLQYL